MATDKQVNYAMALARKAGLSIDWMNAGWKPYATMRQRSGKVQDFLRAKSNAELSALIDTLKAKTGG